MLCGHRLPCSGFHHAGTRGSALDRLRSPFSLSFRLCHLRYPSLLPVSRTMIQSFFVFRFLPLPRLPPLRNQRRGGGWVQAHARRRVLPLPCSRWREAFARPGAEELTLRVASRARRLCAHRPQPDGQMRRRRRRPWPQVLDTSGTAGLAAHTHFCVRCELRRARALAGAATR